MRVRWLNVVALLVVTPLVVTLLATVFPAAIQAAPVTGVSAQTPVAPPTPLHAVVSAPVQPADTTGLPPATEKARAKAAQTVVQEAYPARPLPRRQTAAPSAAVAADPALQNSLAGPQMPAPIVNFEGLNNLDGLLPPDTDGEAGKSHYVQMVNTHTAIYDKQGHLLYGPFTPNSLWPAGGPCNISNNGDPVVLYDQLADRWLLTQFALPNFPNGPFYECIAVSKTGTPTNVPADWWAYTFQISANKMDDYPKLSVWPDGYYMTMNQFVNADAWGGAGVVVFERAKMLAGQAARQQYFDLYSANSNFGGMLPADLDGSTPPPAGSPAYFFEVDDNGPSGDMMSIWRFHTDWTTPANTTFGLSGQPNFTLPVDNFSLLPCVNNGSQNCIPQQGSSQRLDSLGDRLMFRAAYRNFGDHEAVVLSHTVLADGTDRAGIRWYEVRGVSGTPTIFQQGTYAPADGNYRWMGSIAMDRMGNIGLGYSIASSTMYPSIRYTGRLAGDPLGDLPQAEGQVIAGGGAQTHVAARWGDYSAMSVDPVDDCTFWYTQEYLQTTGMAPWQTRIASFRFPNCTAGATGVLSGVVRSAADSTPIAGATVSASTGSGDPVVATTGADGTYSVTLPVASYTVTATAYGYLPKTNTNVAIAAGSAATANFTLDSAPMHTVSGRVTDAQAGWPLYARIDISDYPGGFVWTDPATGHYSVNLMDGVPYTFKAQAYLAGYTPITITVGPLTANQTTDLVFQADGQTCSAPGYNISHGVVALSEQFEGATFPPAGWTVTNNNGGACTWVGDDPAPRGNRTGGAGKFAIADSDKCGSGTSMNTDLLSPVVDVSTLPTVRLSFNYDYLNFSTDTAALDVSADGGATWTNVFTWNSDHPGPAAFDQDLTALLGGSHQARLRFRYIGAFDWYWQIDNVALGDVRCLPQPGGLVMGNVTDVGHTADLAGAQVSNDSGGTTTAAATPTDPNTGEAFYMLFSPAGSHTFTATMPSYPAMTAQVAVPLSSTVRRDFALGAGHLTVTPPAITRIVASRHAVTVPMTLANDGAAPVNFSLVELTRTVTATGPFQKSVIAMESFEQDLPDTEDLELPEPPVLSPLAGGDVLRSWPTGMKSPWGIAFDIQAHSVWVSDGWGDANNMLEFSTSGIPTGRVQMYDWPTTSGPADAAYDWNTGRLWLANINSGVDDCIHEVDPATGPTGKKICPGGGTGFATSQRGLAYDPTTDTFFSGSWNDDMLHRFTSAGQVLADVNVGIPIAGLAYNPQTQHLFIMANELTAHVYVLDVANNYAPLGEFAVPAFDDYGGAGLEIGSDGSLWAVNLTDLKVYQLDSGEACSLCGSLTDVPWLSETPIGGTIPAGSSATINVTLDAGSLAAGRYTARLHIEQDTPEIVSDVPVTMNVIPPVVYLPLIQKP
jgi:hypothetical protein